MGRQAMVGALRRLVFDLLWAPPVKKVLQRVPRVRRIYNGWRRQHPFDLTLGVDTSGAIEANALGVDPDLAAHSSPYGGSQPSILRRCLAALPDPRSTSSSIWVAAKGGRCWWLPSFLLSG